MDGLASRLSSLNPFSGSKLEDDEDIGETIDSNTLAGGGHAGKETNVTHQLRVSAALRAFLAEEGILSRQDAGLDDPNQNTDALRALLEKPHATVPPQLTDRSHPLPDYFISSSHNTYLLAHQLYGNSSAEAYETALKAGSRCVEIDAWDGEDKDEPKITHGFTLTSNIPFRMVCETIRDVVDHEATQAIDVQGYRAAPIFISLENHCSAEGQQRMVDIMHEVFGDRLLNKAIRDKGTEEQEGVGEHVTLAELGSKICVIVEYHFPDETPADNDMVDRRSRQQRVEDEERKEPPPSAIIIPALADLGIYAQSVKPPNDAWFEKGVLESSPHHPLINVSETGLLAHMPVHSSKIANHNSNHLMRVYPKGTRISSANLNPVPFWAVGAQICALNWQTFGASMQLNEALFSGTDGYVLKPASLRHSRKTIYIDKPRQSRKRRLRLYVAGATDVPVPADRPQDGSDIKPYLTCTLVDPTNPPAKQKTAPYKQHKVTGLFHQRSNPPNTEPLWDETLEWEYEDNENELVFLRMLIKSDDAFATNLKLAVSAVRMLYVQMDEWVFIRMLNLKGQETRCSLLVKFEIVDL
ncbi:hypothetical protein H2198_008543 [Neophaeococcomyces mojaviensis]|uniref:Uncharacterized protein n=1 Tax=Neophaeococcomyces mojaviensis TaxID=3383035 RepID=A0ACC2ZX16_9EURO|nr:hypothetical protein H2198_008543 [Knufia sp. JES_112]